MSNDDAADQTTAYESSGNTMLAAFSGPSSKLVGDAEAVDGGAAVAEAVGAAAAVAEAVGAEAVGAEEVGTERARQDK